MERLREGVERGVKWRRRVKNERERERAGRVGWERD